MRNLQLFLQAIDAPTESRLRTNVYAVGAVPMYTDECDGRKLLKMSQKMSQNRRLSFPTSLVCLFSFASFSFCFFFYFYYLCKYFSHSILFFNSLNFHYLCK